MTAEQQVAALFQKCASLPLKPSELGSVGWLAQQILDGFYDYDADRAVLTGLLHKVQICGDGRFDLIEIFNGERFVPIPT
jgi:hypothetical protein